MERLGIIKSASVAVGTIPTALVAGLAATLPVYTVMLRNNGSAAVFLGGSTLMYIPEAARRQKEELERRRAASLIRGLEKPTIKGNPANPDYMISDEEVSSKVESIF